MEILELEQKYSELQNFIDEHSSNRTKLLRISEFMGLVLSNLKPNLAEAYLIELFPKYLSAIRKLKIRGLKLETLSFLLNQYNDIKDFDFLKDYKKEIEEARNVLQKKYELMCSWLEGSVIDGERNIIYFPVLEKNESDEVFGFLEIIKVGIEDGENQFNIYPPESENDSQLEHQLHLCWNNALGYCKNYIKRIKQSHTVELKFENSLGVYVGNSLGIALTLAFIEAILKYYNSKIIVKINGCIAVTGGIDDNSKIISTSKIIIETKVEAVFFSDAQMFCVPKVDEMWAEKKLINLNTQYPNRKFKIIGIADLDDLLSRRNVVDIRKQSPIVRLYNYALNKWISISMIALLTILLTYIFAIDFDNNPAMFEQKGRLLSVQNRNGKMLWNVNLIFDPNFIGQDLTAGSRKIIDINGDGLNEILICEEDFSYDDNRRGRVVCFDNKKNIIWDYNFKDTVSTFRTWTNSYFISIIDTITIQNSKVLLLRARNEPNFPNAVFMLDLKLGKRFDSLNTLWNAGGITNCIIGDYNEDGERELVLGGLNNGYECAVFFSVNLDRIKGQTPSKERYVFKNIPKAITINRLKFNAHNKVYKITGIQTKSGV